MTSFDRRSRTWLLCAAAAPRAGRRAQGRFAARRTVALRAGRRGLLFRDAGPAGPRGRPGRFAVRRSGAAIAARRLPSRRRRSWTSSTRSTRHLRQSFGVGFDQLRDDILGDAVVFAYRPGPPDKPDQEQGLILVRARNGGRARLPGGQDQHGPEEGRHADRRADMRVSGRRPTSAASNRTRPIITIFAVRCCCFSGQEEMLRQAIDVDRKTAAGAEPPLARRLREVGRGSCSSGVVAEPAGVRRRPGDESGEGGGDRRGVPKEAADVLEGDGRPRGLGDAGHGAAPVVGGAGAARRPAAGGAAAVCGRVSSQRGLWRYFPDDALLACGGRIDAGAVLDLLQEFPPKDDGSAAARCVPRQRLSQGRAVAHRSRLGLLRDCSAGRRQGLAAAGAAGGAGRAGRRRGPGR